jgi:uncharacterized protein
MTASEQRWTIERAVVWRGQAVDTLELCRLKLLSGPDGGAWALVGTGVARVDGALTEFNYQVNCDQSWRTLGTSVYLGTPEGRQILLVPKNGVWEGKQLGSPSTEPNTSLGVLDGLDGCMDVDIGVTPATNTLPIRRLNLQVGESAEVTAAWVRFPELTVEPLAQRYTRLDERRYRYESASGFSAELEVDELGLVVRYGDIWERVGG